MRVSVTGDVPDSPALSELEAAVLDAATAGDAALREQAAAAAVVSRTYSGVGFVTKLRVPPEGPRTDIAVVPVVHGRHPALPDPAEFRVELREGRLSCIEAFCFQGLWPADEHSFELTPAG